MQFQKVSLFTYPFCINYTRFRIEFHRLQTCTLLSFNSGENTNKHMLIIEVFCMIRLISHVSRPLVVYCANTWDGGKSMLRAGLPSIN